EAPVVTVVVSHHRKRQKIRPGEATILLPQPSFDVALALVQPGGCAGVLQARQLQQADRGSGVRGSPVVGRRNLEHATLGAPSVPVVLRLMISSSCAGCATTQRSSAPQEFWRSFDGIEWDAIIHVELTGRNELREPRSG